jgi:hypothetical protein
VKNERKQNEHLGGIVDLTTEKDSKAEKIKVKRESRLVTTQLGEVIDLT